MATHLANGNPLLSFWPRVREYAVPPPMIETATARRRAGDWAGACAAAGFDVDLHPRSVARAHGRDLADRIRADLRHLAPDLLRWHMPRIAPDGLLRPGLTLTLARYATGRDDAPPVHLVARTPPAWADAGQRISLALWDGSRADDGARRHPHPLPSRRFRLDLHRHLWDVRRAEELRVRSGADRPPPDEHAGADPDLWGTLPPGDGRAVDRWAAEAAILLRAESRPAGRVAVRLGSRHRLVLDVETDADPAHAGPPVPRITAAAPDDGSRPLPVLPDAATWTLPDLDLLRAGAIDADRLHPLVASALVPGHPSAVRPRTEDPAAPARLVECRGARHHIGLVDGVLAPLDHDPDEIRREELLAALGGPPLPCLRAVDEAHRRPDCLAGVRERLQHGDTAGALAVVEGLLGPDVLLRDGALRDALEDAARRRIAYGLFRAGLAGHRSEHGSADAGRPLDRRRRPRHATFH
ncbi:hypothetical protein [Streptomyces sp. A012304]|uniref:hypothetical protein n=1 Tax=Streptomyces sp. A012304 TaxID=375446 RepID=UPI00222E119A|nr:hypothetical protein [Streptomyces sp. A012304]GKQ40455.1 hypothetical protein ALMP_69810 [Streptomyces sp. A012304]